MSRTTLTIPEELRDQAKALDINISEVARYALEGAIPAARAARNAGIGFEPVTITWVSEEFDQEELVQFLGREVADNYPIRVFVTPKGAIVELYNTGDGQYREDRGDMEVFEDLEAFRRHVKAHADHDGEWHRVLQSAEEVLGQAPTPRMLDI